MTKKEGKATASSTSTPPTSARLLKNRPLDQHSDDVEVRPKEQVFGEAAEELGPEHIEEPKQAELLAMPEEATRPVAVQNGRMLATYVGLGLERDKNNEKLVHLDFSFALEDAHNGFIPKKVKEAWKFLKDSDNKLIWIKGIPPITLGVFMDPKAKKPELHLIAAEFTKAVIQIVEETGKGKIVMVTRFAFRVRASRHASVMDFAAWRDGESFWIVMPQTQEAME